jgi:lipid-A-disaccharide synthase-like uncharacterized protein
MHPSTWDIWVAIGFVGQFLFAARFIVQWISSERRRESHIPIQFWYLSLIGGTPEDLAALMKKGFAVYGKLVKAAGLKPE